MSVLTACFSPSLILSSHSRHPSIETDSCQGHQGPPVLPSRMVLSFPNLLWSLSSAHQLTAIFFLVYLISQSFPSPLDTPLPSPLPAWPLWPVSECLLSSPHVNPAPLISSALRPLMFYAFMQLAAIFLSPVLILSPSVSCQVFSTKQSAQELWRILTVKNTDCLMAFSFSPWPLISHFSIILL